MPIYEYDCPKCSAHFEVLVRNAGDIPETCPECGKGKPVKAFSTFAPVAASMPSCADGCCSASRSCASGNCANGACGLG